MDDGILLKADMQLWEGVKNMQREIGKLSELVKSTHHTSPEQLKAAKMHLQKIRLDQEIWWASFLSHIEKYNP